MKQSLVVLRILGLLISVILLAACGANVKQDTQGTVVAQAVQATLTAVAQGTPTPDSGTAAPDSSSQARPLVDAAQTMTGKVLAGYQGWFSCPGDGSQLDYWKHWTGNDKPAVQPDNITVDMWPDTSELTQNEMCETDLLLPSGEPAMLFSSYKLETVLQHFQWMSEYGIDGIFLQRFSSELQNDSTFSFSDQLVRNVMEAAKTHDRVFAIMYDVTNQNPATLNSTLEADWRHLVNDLKILESPFYLHHDGKPVVGIWGLGFNGKNYAASPAQAASLLKFFQEDSDEHYRATVLGGVPTGWRTLSGDVKADSAWNDIYSSFDIISPWIVARFRDEAGADEFRQNILQPDLELVTQRDQGYLPVVFPGFSWRNLMTNRDGKQDKILNEIPRNGGQFFWRQIYNAIDSGASMLYIAMFDEVDEGTAIFKLAQDPSALPIGVSLVSLDKDGYALPNDWYLRLSGKAGEMLRREIPISPEFPLELPAVDMLAAKNSAPAAPKLDDIIAIAAGYDNTCALTTARGVKCWGNNYYGQLGDGTTLDRSTPVDVSGLSSSVRSISAGMDHTCALTMAGGVTCWGDNQFGQLGDGTKTTRSQAVDVSGLTSGVKSISAGYLHTCALTALGGVMCWGENDRGQLGDGTTINRDTPVAPMGLSSGVEAISAGNDYTCALTTEGRVTCWGTNGIGELGNDTTGDHPKPVDVSILGSQILTISAGSSHTCAVTREGSAICWGWNASGQLGDGTMALQSGPEKVSGLKLRVGTITAGGMHTCALTEQGSVTCWGDNSSAQLGNGTMQNQPLPVELNELSSGIQAISAGHGHTCALTTEGSVTCWGNNSSGQLGNGTTRDRYTPVGVGGLSSGVQAIVSRGAEHTCALTVAGGVMCWGNNESGQLGDGTTTNRYTPADVVGLNSGVQAISAGTTHTCALTLTGEVVCWGGNEYGQLGDGITTNHLTPVKVGGLSSDVQAISAGYAHTCALTAAGGVKCWGANPAGQLGDGTPISRYTPGDVNGLSSGVQAISSGGGHVCALTTTGGVKCWGHNYDGELGDGTKTERYTPVDVSGLSSGVQAISGGMYYTCALTMAGATMCWGNNDYGQLGDGTTTNRYTPVEVSGLGSDVQAISASWRNTCALTKAGGTICWGDNDFGQLGDGTTTDQLTPVEVSGPILGVQAISSGIRHTCALTSAGGVVCWGNNEFGKLGVDPGWTPVDVIAPR